MTALHPFVLQLDQAWPARQWSDLTVTIGVSGGPDSVALLTALIDRRRSLAERAGPGRLVVAHFNHKLRGEESAADASFVDRLCQRLAVPCEFGQPEGRAPQDSVGEAELRAERYQFLEQVARRHGARFLATAHTAEDQAETVLHRILRGTGLPGLAGIPAARPLNELTTVVRPLLAASRTQVLQFLIDRQQDYRLDSSNGQLDYTRNRLRLELLPLLRDQFNPHVVNALRRLGQLAGEAQSVVDARTNTWYDRCVTRRSDGGSDVDCRLLSDASEYEVAELMIMIWKRNGWPLQAMDHARWRQLAHVVRAESPSVPPATYPGRIRVHRTGPHLRLTP